MRSQPLPPHLLELFATRGALGRRELLAQGITDNDLRRWVRTGELARPRAGYYCLNNGLAGHPAELVPLIQRLQGAVTAGVDVVVSHRSAARLWGLPVWGRPTPPEITRAYGTRAVTGCVVHRYGVADESVVDMYGLPVTGAARTLIDVCRVTSASAGLVTVDAGVRDLNVDLAAATSVLENLGDINFRRRVLQVFSWADPGSENPFESFSRGQLLGEGVPEPLLQWWVGDGEGLWFRPDKLWASRGLIGEADGRWKYRKRDNGPDVDDGVLVREKDRQDWFTDRDFLFVRYSPEGITRAPGYYAKRWWSLSDRQEQRGWRWPRGVWLVEPGPWPPLRPEIIDESGRFRHLP